MVALYMHRDGCVGRNVIDGSLQPNGSQGKRYEEDGGEMLQDG